MQKSNFMKMAVLKKIHFALKSQIFNFFQYFFFWNAMFLNGDFRNRGEKTMAVTVWPAKTQNWEFCTLLYHARKLDCLPFRTEFLFSWLEKLAYYLSWQEKQAQLNFWLIGAKLKKSKITDFFQVIFRNCANLLILPQNWYKCIPCKILRCRSEL